LKLKKLILSPVEIGGSFKGAVCGLIYPDNSVRVSRIIEGELPPEEVRRAIQDTAKECSFVGVIEGDSDIADAFASYYGLDSYAFISYGRPSQVADPIRNSEEHIDLFFRDYKEGMDFEEIPISPSRVRSILHLKLGGTIPHGSYEVEKEVSVQIKEAPKKKRPLIEGKPYFAFSFLLPTVLISAVAEIEGIPFYEFIPNFPKFEAVLIKEVFLEPVRALMMGRGKTGYEYLHAAQVESYFLQSKAESGVRILYPFVLDHYPKSAILYIALEESANRLKNLSLKFRERFFKEGGKGNRDFALMSASALHELAQSFKDYFLPADIREELTRLSEKLEKEAEELYGRLAKEFEVEEGITEFFDLNFSKNFFSPRVPEILQRAGIRRTGIAKTQGIWGVYGSACVSRFLGYPQLFEGDEAFSLRITEVWTFIDKVIEAVSTLKEEEFFNICTQKGNNVARAIYDIALEVAEKEESAEEFKRLLEKQRKGLKALFRGELTPFDFYAD